MEQVICRGINTKLTGVALLWILHPDVQFYDYTKVLNYLDHGNIKNYHITFSDSGTNYKDQVEAMTKYFVNVAVVFKDQLPKNLDESYPLLTGINMT